MDYPCAEFGYFSFSGFGFILRTDRQTDRITEADDRYTHAAIVGVSRLITYKRVNELIQYFSTKNYYFVHPVFFFIFVLR